MRKCQNCGNSVTESFAKVFGDNNDVVTGCLECTTYKDLRQGHHL